MSSPIRCTAAIASRAVLKMSVPWQARGPGSLRPPPLAPLDPENPAQRFLSHANHILLASRLSRTRLGIVPLSPGRRFGRARRPGLLPRPPAPRRSALVLARSTLAPDERAWMRSWAAHAMWPWYASGVFPPFLIWHALPGYSLERVAPSLPRPFEGHTSGAALRESFSVSQRKGCTAP